MSLSNGVYIIRSVDTGRHVGRNIHEDVSVFPKNIVVLPNGVQAPPWFLKSGPEGYVLSAIRAPTAAIDNKVFAILLDFPPPTNWTLTPSGADIFTIGVRDRVWTAPTDPNEDPTVSLTPWRPLPNPLARFEFVRIDRDYGGEDSDSE